MNETRNLQSGKTGLPTALKVGLAVAVLSLMALTLEQPRLSAAPAGEAKSVEAVAYLPGSGPSDDAGANATSSRDMSVPTPASTAEYFPSRFAPPQAEAELLPPTF